MSTVNKENKNIKVAVGLSGGVDSAVSAYILKEQGYDVTGVYMQCWDAKADGCRADEDRAEALRVAEHIGIPFKSLDFIKEYKERVINHFYSEYQAGRTPNPDVLCNKEIKFGMFLEWAVAEGFDKIATGHYARVEENATGGYSLMKGVDETKDQSYFLYLLNQDQLSRAIFPVGGMKKEEVRRVAESVSLPNSSRPDSVGICFIGEVDIRDFLKKKIPAVPGNVVKDGEVIGRHDGVPFYTIGQRHGFSVDKYFGLPLYVIGKDVERNELVVGFAKDGQRDSFEVGDLHWIGGAGSKNTPDRSFEADVRIRHLGELYPANCILGGDSVGVRLVDKTFGVAPGQSAVFYQEDVVLGGGIIR